MFTEEQPPLACIKHRNHKDDDNQSTDLPRPFTVFDLTEIQEWFVDNAIRTPEIHIQVLPLQKRSWHESTVTLCELPF